MRRVALAAAAVGLLTLAGCDYAPVSDKVFGERVRAYLVRHPEVLQEVSDALQAKREAQMRTELDASVMKSQKLVPTYRQAIENDSRDFVANPQGKVTVTEFYDYRCPHCINIAPKVLDLIRDSPGVRVVFKEFPLPMHDWSHTAAIANECAYQINPSAFVAYRSLIFKNQSSITVTSVRDLMLQYGEEAGVDRLRLAACIDSKASLPRIEAGHREGEKLGVSSTPTSFINGRILVGGYFTMVGGQPRNYVARLTTSTATPSPTGTPSRTRKRCATSPSASTYCWG